MLGRHDLHHVYDIVNYQATFTVPTFWTQYNSAMKRWAFHNPYFSPSKSLWDGESGDQGRDVLANISPVTFHIASAQ